MTLGIDCFWTFQIILQLLLFFYLLRQKHYVLFGSFTTYIGFLCLRSLGLRAIVFCHGGNAAYFYTYWIASLAEDVLLIAVLLELARFLFAPYWIVPANPKRWFHLGLAVLLSFSALLPLFSYSTLGRFSYDWYLLAFARTADRTISIAMLGTTIMGISLSLYLSIPWKRKACLIAMGFLIQFATQTWFSFAVLSAAAAQATSLQWIRLMLFTAGLMCWLAACFVPEHSAIPIDEESVLELELTLRTLTGEART